MTVLNPFMRPLIIPFCSEATLLTLEAVGVTIDDFSNLRNDLVNLTCIQCILAPSSTAAVGANDGFYDGTGKLNWGELPFAATLQRLNLESSTMLAELPSALPPTLQLFNLRNTSLSGTIPPTFFSSIGTGPDPHLLYCYLDSNQLNGTIPPALFAFPARTSDLSHLVVNFSHNELSGPLPDFSYSLAVKISFIIDFSYNALFGSIPSGYFHPRVYLPKASIFSFNIQHNQLSGPIPNGLFDDFGELGSLFVFDASSNALTSLPDALQERNRNQWYPPHFAFLVSNNSITGTIPPQLFSETFRRLETEHVRTGFHLDVSDNQLTGSIPSGLLAFMDADNLLKGPLVHSSLILRFANNLLNGSIPEDLLSAAYRNAVSPTTILDFSGNDFSGSVSSTTFANVPSGSNLTVSFAHNSFTEAPPCPPNVKMSIYLNDNQITSIPSSWQSCLFHSVDLSNNQLSGTLPASLLNATSISSFNARNNPLLLGALPRIGSSLRSFDLSGTGLDLCNSSSLASFSTYSGDTGSCGLNETQACGCSSSYSTCSPNCLIPICSYFTRPSNDFECINGVWTARTVTGVTLAIPSNSGKIVVNGTLTSSTIIFRDLNTSVEIIGCADELGLVEFELSLGEAEKIGKSGITRTLITTTNTSCTDLNRVGLRVKVRDGGCKKVVASKRLSEDRQSLIASFRLDTSSCNTWWIIVVAVVSAVVLVGVIVTVILVTSCSRVKMKVRPFAGSDGGRHPV